MATLVVLYIGLCCLVAYLGRDRKFGFWGYLAASVIFDPVIGILLVLASDKKSVAAPAAPVA
jgi:hypothetical protein